jgi:hypothetical protein
MASVLIPASLFFTGVFSANYAWMLIYPMVFFVVALLCREAWTVSMRAIAVVLAVTFLAPHSLFREAVYNRLLLIREGNPLKRIEQFANQTLRPGDIAWIDEKSYYVIKPKIRRIFTTPVVFLDFGGTNTYPDREKDRNSVRIGIWPKSKGVPCELRLLPGKWEPSGEGYHAWGQDIVVYRRIDAPPQ